MRKWKVLVVDDEKEIAEYMGALAEGLLKEHAIVEVLSSGTKALHRLKEASFDLLITDMVMPVTDGLALLSYVTANKPAIEVIFLTAYEEFEYLYKVNKLKNCGYMIKTEKEEVIEKTILTAVRRLEERVRQSEVIEQARVQIEEVRHVFHEEKVKQMLSYEEEIVSEDILTEREQEQKEKYIIHQIKDYVKAHIHEDISAASVAAVFHYSPAYLSRIFRQYGKEKLSTYIIQKKMKEAKKLLVETDKTVSMIASILGYQSSQAFARAFRRELSTTPQEYRRTHSERYQEVFQPKKQD